MTEETEKKPAPRKTATAKVAHVYTALAEILKALSVEKNGQLPGNMGGKSYISAVDLSLEVKRQFVENNLLLLPEEEVTRHEIFNDNGRKTTTLTIQGHYTIVSTVDESFVQISGTGDGLSTGASVASNIASTNALKNALLRTFLVTEQSVEDEAKNGPKEVPTSAPAQRTQSAAPDLNAARTKLVEVAGSQAEATRRGNEYFNVAEGEPAMWSAKVDKIQELIKHLQTGEV